MPQPPHADRLSCLEPQHRSATNQDPHAPVACGARWSGGNIGRDEGPGRGAPGTVPGPWLVADCLDPAAARPDDPNFFPLLLDKIAHSPDFFRNAPLVLDVGPLAAREPLDMAALAERLREHRLMPVGVQNGSPAWNEAATRKGLAVFGAGGSARAPAESPAGASGTVAAATSSQAAPGAHDPRPSCASRCAAGNRSPPTATSSSCPPSVPERAAAAGHIHVYGILRGRASPGSRATRRP